jgi:serine/threonine protein kinase
MLSEEVVAAMTAQLVMALELLQSKKIMHRDLKPQNIMLDDNYNLKLVTKKLL